MFLSAQIFEFLGLLFIIFAMQLKSRKQLLLYKLLSTAFILTGYFFIGSTAGILIGCVSLMRGLFSLLFAYTDNTKIKNFAIIFLCLMTFLLNYFFWKGYLNILSIVISLISIFGFFQAKTIKIRIFSVLTSILEVVLNIIIFNPMEIIIEVFTISSSVFGIIRNDIVHERLLRRSAPRKD